jgi:hypothetical protein
VKKITAIILLSFISLGVYAQASKDYTVQIKLSVQQSPLRFNLRWGKATGATQYKVFSKSLQDLSWKPLATLNASDTFYTDSTVKAGQGIEYQVVSITPSYNGYGYIYAANKLDAYNYKGKLLLLVDSNYKQPLAKEITQLQADLRGDGWQITTHYIARSATPPQVKKHITDLWKQDSTNFKSVYLLGHIPVPYSGFIGPDGHNDHFGAWPADLYYSVVDNSTWTDYVLSTTSAARTKNHNVPNDGKFDVDYIVPGSAKLQVGRVDMFDMPSFALSGMNDTDLTKQYLKKAHNFKVNKYPVVLRGLIDDQIGGFGGEAFVRGGWGSFSGMFGDSIIEGKFLPDMKARSYMFNVSSGFGSYTASSGIASVGDFTKDSITCPFTSHFGSYFGDWDNNDNFLRAGLASKSLVLTATWSGRPVYYFHQMALGQTIGHSAMASANSPRNLYHSKFASNSVHMALMGDPSLRLHPITPISNLAIKRDCDKITLNWIKSNDTAISGYRIYRADSINGEYKWVAITALDSFEDKTVKAGLHYYMVRPERLQKTPSGTYYNLGLGMVDSISFYPAPKPIINVNDTLKCEGEAFIIKNGTVSNEPYTESWRVDGTKTTLNDSIVYTPNLSGEYFLSFAVTSKQGCYDSISKKIIVGAIPNSVVNIAKEGICIDSNKIYFATPGGGINYKYRWVISNGDTLRTQNPVKVFTSEGNYTVQLFIEDSLTGCNSNSKVTPIIINPKPVAPVISGSSIVKHRIPYTYTIVAKANHTYTWSVNENPDLFQTNNDSLTLRWDNGLLTATIKLVERDTAGCKSDTAYFQVWTIVNSLNQASKNISIYPVPVKGNELFILNKNKISGEAKLSIFDIQGRVISSSTIIIQEGENTVDISGLSNGTYYLSLKMGDIFNTQKFVKTSK